MSMLSFTNFTKGELGPELQARIDTSQYAAGAKKVRNFIIQRYGGLSFRPGFRFVGEADSTTDDVRYVSFQYNIEQSYIMALGDYSMRLLANGGFILEDNLNIISVTKGSTTIVEVAFHAYSVGDRVYFNGETGMTELNNTEAKVLSVIDDSHFEVNINSTNFSDFVSSDGITRTGPPTPPTPPAPLPPPVVVTPPPSTSPGHDFHNRFDTLSSTNEMN